MSTTVYGNLIDSSTAQCYYTYSSEETNTSRKITISAAGLSVPENQGTKRSHNFTLSADGYDTRTASLATSSSYRTGKHSVFSSKTYTFAKKASSSSRTVDITLKMTAPQTGSTSTKTVTFTIPHLDSYTISYNGNGADSGSVSSQTKYYGNNITLRSNSFTRANYTFVGWNTKSDGTGTTYAAGASYSGNASKTLYAMWQLNYVIPSITNIEVFRTATSSSTSKDLQGQYARIIFDYVGGHYPDEAATVPSCEIIIGEDTYTPSLSASGTYTANLGGSYSSLNNYDVSIRLYDSVYSAGTTVTRKLYAATTPISIIKQEVLPNYYYPNVGIMCQPSADPLEFVTMPNSSYLYDSSGEGTTGKILSALDIKQIVLSYSSVTIAAGETASFSTDLTQYEVDGWHAIGITGVYIGYVRNVLVRDRLTTNDDGIHKTSNVTFRNASSSSGSSGSVYVYVLFARIGSPIQSITVSG